MLISQHLKSRRLSIELYSGIFLDSVAGVATFPLWNMMGCLVGLHQYRPYAPKSGLTDPRSQKYFTRFSKTEKDNHPLTGFGLDLISPDNSVLFIAEGLFDVSPLHQRGANALALLSNNPRHIKPWLQCLGYHVVALCDGDNAGADLTAFAHESIILPEGQDPGDQSDDWFSQLVAFYH